MSIFKSKTVKILSIDGGGIRGIIPAIILKHIENRLRQQKKNRRTFSEIFDLIAGTSTGAFITMGLVMPKSDPDNQKKYLKEPALTLNDLIDFYVTKGIKIFSRSIFDKLRSIVHAGGEKYDDETLENILEDIFKKVTIKDALTNIIITSYETEKRMPFFFKKRPLTKKKENYFNFYMKDAARSSSAAPTFFDPAHISPVPPNGKRYCLIDGGVYANNPAMCAYIEARKIYPDAKEYIILSMGTGITKRSFSYEELKSWDPIDWLKPGNGIPLVSIMANGQSECVNHQLFKMPGVKFYRINSILEDCNEEMDDASEKNIEKLNKTAFRTIALNNEAIDELCDIL